MSKEQSELGADDLAEAAAGAEPAVVQDAAVAGGDAVVAAEDAAVAAADDDVLRDGLQDAAVAAADDLTVHCPAPLAVAQNPDFGLLALYCRLE